MGPLDFVNHAANLFVVPLAMAAIAAGAAKVLWRRELAALSWWSLAWPVGLANVAVTVAALALFLQDGKMATYGAMVLVSALVLWWRGFLAPPRR